MICCTVRLTDSWTVRLKDRRCSWNIETSSGPIAIAFPRRCTLAAALATEESSAGWSSREHFAARAIATRSDGRRRGMRANDATLWLL